MRYIGGKSKIAAGIRNAILAEVHERIFYLEPFLGGGSTFRELAPYFKHSCASDIHPDLMMMWMALRDGWEPPADISEQEYALIRNSPASALRGLAGFGQSFGGKFFGGYARGSTHDGEPRNYLAETVRNLGKIVPVMERTELYCCDYADWSPLEGVTAYCDPPYEGTQGYKGADKFDHARFWQVMDQWHENGARVFVSEYAAPPHWEVLATFNGRQSLSRADHREDTTEKLWIRREAG